MEIVLLRHGQTAGNLENRYIGKTDQPLSPAGIAAVRRLAKQAALAAPAEVYVSPLRRARETAALLFPQARQVVCLDLREMDFGDFEGRNADEMEHDPAYRAWVDGLCRGACPNGESPADFAGRVGTAFDEIVRGAVRQGLDQLTIVAHGGTIMAIMQLYARPPRDFYAWQVRNGGGWRASLDEASWAARPALVRYQQL